MFSYPCVSQELPHASTAFVCVWHKAKVFIGRVFPIILDCSTQDMGEAGFQSYGIASSNSIALALSYPSLYSYNFQHHVLQEGDGVFAKLTEREDKIREMNFVTSSLICKAVRRLMDVCFQGMIKYLWENILTFPYWSIPRSLSQGFRSRLKKMGVKIELWYASEHGWLSWLTDLTPWK